jgi:hypothetical protein
LPAVDPAYLDLIISKNNSFKDAAEKVKFQTHLEAFIANWEKRKQEEPEVFVPEKENNPEPVKE